MILGVEGKRIHVNAYRGDIGVVLEGLHQVEVLAFTLSETVMAVQLDLGSHNGVLARKTLHHGDRVARLQHRAVKPVGVVEGLLALVGVHCAVAGNKRVALDNPDEFLTRVVEGHLDLVGAGGDRFITSELQLLNQILVSNLGKAAALLSIQVDVVNIQRRRHQTRSGNAVADGGVVGPAQVAELIQLQVQLHLVILQSNQRQSKTSVAVKPELERNVESVLGGTRAGLVGCMGLATGTVIITATIGLLGQSVHQLRNIANHLSVAGLLASGAGQLIPDVEPVTVVLVNALATNFNLHILDEVVADPVEPAELGTGAILSGQLNLGESGLEIHTMDKVAITADGAGYTLSEVGNTIEGLLNRLHREVGVATIKLLKEGNLRVCRQINVLSTVGDELHQTTTCHSLYSGVPK